MIKLNDVIINQESFGDGTLKCQVPVEAISLSFNFTWCYDYDGELFALWCLVQHIKQTYTKPIITLDLPYIPHARQDRNVSGRLFTLKYFSQILNMMGFDSVTVFDPHSDVSTALIDRVKVANFNLDTVLKDIPELKDINYQLMYPDNGAAKKYNAGENDIIGYKHRNSEGRIESYSFTGLNPETKIVIIRDDICSYGGTFVAAAKALKEQGVEKVYLIVSHCENNILKGDVFKYIDLVYTTDSICAVTHPQLMVKSFWRT